MIRHIFYARCLECAEVCSHRDILCNRCVEKLERIEVKCANCGYPLPVPSNRCGHCTDIVDHYYADYVYSGGLKKALLSIKFNWRWRGISQLVELCIAKDLDINSYNIITAVPYHKLRKLSRFHQPVDLLLDYFRFKGGAVQQVVLRKKNTPYQSRLSRAKRKENVQGVFDTTKKLEGSKILLVDDLLTTGATVTEITKELKRAGAKSVDVYTLLAGVRR